MLAARRHQEPTEQDITQIQKRLRELIDHMPKASAPPPSAAPPSGIVRPETERHVFRLAVIIGTALIVVALLFMFWQRFPIERPIQHSPVLQSK